MKHVVIGPPLAEVRTHFRTFYLLTHFLPPPRPFPVEKPVKSFLYPTQQLFCFSDFVLPLVKMPSVPFWGKTTPGEEGDHGVSQTHTGSAPSQWRGGSQ